MKKIALLVLMLATGFFINPAPASAEEYLIDTKNSHAFIQFKIPHLGYSWLLGRFNQLEGSFNATMFYADIEGHPDERLVKLAMEELAFFTSEVRILGTYPASPFRADLKGTEG